MKPTRANLGSCGWLAAAMWMAACGNDLTPVQSKQLPCDVERVLADHCQGCHGAPTQFGAPMELVTWSDLHAPSASDSKHEVYELLEDHLSGKKSLMPPPPNMALSASEKKTLSSWIDEGAPPGVGESCGANAAGPEPAPVYSGLSEAPADCENFYEFRAHGSEGEKDTTPFSLAASEPGQNTYECFYFKTPYAADATGLWAHSLLDNLKVLHHWILYGTDNATQPSGTSAPCSAALSNARFIAGWAPGGTDYALPSDVGLELPSGPSAGLILQIHYYSPDGKAAKDRSGVKLCTAKKGARAHLASVSYTGSEGICLPPGESQTVSGICDPRDDRGDIHILGVAPHMHKLGHRMKITVLRADGSTEVMFDEPFEFTSQSYYPLPIERWILHPGDRLQTDCYYENDTTAPVSFGERTQDEMCYGFVTAWPAGALDNDPNNIVQQFAGLVYQKNHCLDQLSILKSCDRGQGIATGQ